MYKRFASMAGLFNRALMTAMEKKHVDLLKGYIDCRLSTNRWYPYKVLAANNILRVETSEPHVHEQLWLLKQQHAKQTDSEADISLYASEDNFGGPAYAAEIKFSEMNENSYTALEKSCIGLLPGKKTVADSPRR